MSGAADASVLAAAREQAQLSGWELWLRYFALGGTATREGLECHIMGGGVLDDHQNDVLVHALNERFAEMDLGHPLPYVFDEYA
jgi:hypothetical protein